MKCALVPIANGTEEIEAVCIIDVLRRAGTEVTVAVVDAPTSKSTEPSTFVKDNTIYLSGGSNTNTVFRLKDTPPSPITASRGTRLVGDVFIAECANEIFDLIAVPGGMPGAEHLRDSEVLTKLLKEQCAAGRWYAAICAAPVVVLQHHGLLSGRKATCHPSFAEQLEDKSQVKSRVVVDGSCITSRGPGTALEFALKLVEMLYDAQTALDLAGHMLVNM